MNDAPYEDGSGRPILRDSIAAFIDELGFSERVKKLTAGDLREDVERYRTVRQNFAPSGGRNRDLRVLYFSDNVGLTLPIDADGTGRELLTIIQAAATYQMQLTLGSRFVRGGITRGEIYADDSFITGPALIEAVELEKTATVPRILLDDACVALAKEELKAHARLETAVLPRSSSYASYEFLLLNDGSHVFCNYLGALLSQEHAEFQIEFVLENHRDSILAGVSQHRNNENIAAKYRWAARYHNYFVTQIIQYPNLVVSFPEDGDFTPFTTG